MKSHHLFQTSFGWCALVFRRPSPVVVEILLPGSRGALAARLADAGTQITRPPEAIQHLATEIRNYFDHPPHPTAVPPDLLDFSGMTPLQRRVLDTTAAIPFGQTRSYGQVAASAGLPRAARFVGNTMARNPFPVVVPCHRVVRADGSPGLFGGGTDLKRRMLRLEGLAY